MINSMAGIAQLVRAPVCGTGGRGFKSHYSPQNILDTERCLFLFAILSLKSINVLENVMAGSATQKTTTEKSADEKYCNSCGNIIKKDAEICPKCGVRQHAAPQAQSNAAGRPLKDKTTAGVLALLLGGIGIHKFYLGRPGLGIVYILFCWTLIPGIIAFVECIIYFTFSGTDQEFTARYAY